MCENQSHKIKTSDKLGFQMSWDIRQVGILDKFWFQTFIVQTQPAKTKIDHFFELVLLLDASKNEN